MIRTPIRAMTALLAIAGLSLVACGDESDDTASEAEVRSIEIEMRDIEFSPDSVKVKSGETVRFVFHNAGKVAHEAFIGDKSAQDDHAMEMSSEDHGMDMGDSGSSDADETGIIVDPGDTGELTYTFREGDEILIGCHQDGHYDAGMRAMVNMG